MAKESPPAEGAEQPVKKKKTLLLIIIAVVVVVVLGAGAAAVFLLTVSGLPRGRALRCRICTSQLTPGDIQETRAFNTLPNFQKVPVQEPPESIPHSCRAAAMSDWRPVDSPAVAVE